MTWIVICAVAFAASALTFFSGFGLGTLLLPAFALFYPVEVAVASTAVVHFLNGLFKLTLVGRHADRATVLRFGLPAIVAAVAGAWLLVHLADAAPIATYSVLGIVATILPAKLAVGALLLLITTIELMPRFQSLSIPSRYVPLGGVLSGFFGGLSGMQGALRSAFLIRLGLSKEAFIGTGVVVATLIDISRLGVYAQDLLRERSQLDYGLLAAAVLAAFVGAFFGNQFLRKLTLRSIQLVVGTMLILVALGLIAGLL
ncbi:MAG: sulfite exporter TauE/SafE family protein [Gemmatimonadota bacterium]